MADKNFTQFDLRSPLIETDFLVGYKAGGSAELRTTVRDILDLVPPANLEIPPELIVNTLIADNIVTSNLRFENQILTDGGPMPSNAVKFLDVNINGVGYLIPLVYKVTPTSFLYSLTGPDNQDITQKITIFSNNYADTILYNDWDYYSSSYTATIIYVNGVERSNVSHTIDRIGTQFGYTPSGGSQTFIGTFNGGNVFF